jgi:predicted metal-dependent hydrolase
MNTDRQITVSGISVQVVRKPIKNLHLGVYPPEGRVRIAVPLAMSDNAIRLAIVGKLAWIKRQRARFEAQPRQPRREMVSGESHYFLGRRYRLRIVLENGPAKVFIRNRSTIELHIARQATAAQREKTLRNWYRQQLRSLIPPLLANWQSILGLRVSEWGIRRMKTKWGTCNPKAGRIWLNLELAKKPRQCLEYIVVHEMAHLITRYHDDRFVAIMSRHLPHWERYRDELNAAPLSHETWRLARPAL